MNNSELCEIAKKHEDRGEIEKAYQCYLEAALAEDDGEARGCVQRSTINFSQYDEKYLLLW